MYLPWTVVVTSTAGTFMTTSSWSVMIPTRAVATVMVWVLATDHAWVATKSDDFCFGVLASFCALRLEVVWGILPLLTILAGVFNGCSQLWALVTAWATWAAWST